jgi:ATP-dependent Lon protease
MAPAKPVTLPVIPLAKDTVLLPGIVLRIPVAVNRPDIPALLSSVYSRAASKSPSQRLDHVNIACVPLNSPFLTKNGQKMISQDERSLKPKERLNMNPSSATKEDLFGYGVAAKISGVEGRGTGEFALIVEGVARIRIDKLTQERPFFEAEVTYEYDEGRL